MVQTTVSSASTLHSEAQCSQHRLANVAGTQEPDYGPSAIQSVTKQSPQYTELTTEDLKWNAMESTNVETETFYFMTDEGVTVMAQLIYSNVA